VQSLQLAQAQTRSLHKRLAQAQEALAALQPLEPKRGRKRYHNCAELQSLAEGIIAKWEVLGLVQVAVTETSPLDLQLVVSIDTEAVTSAIRRLGWRVYATNQKAEILSLEVAVGAYRSEYLIEHNFGRLKGRQLSVQPLQVISDERVVGLLRLLSIGLRVFGLLEYQVRTQLSEQKAQLAGLYDGNPKRSTARPTTEGLLKAFKGINLTSISGISGTTASQHHITVLSGLQERILALLELPLNLYSRLTLILDELPPQMSEP
jgi:transposase